MSSQRSARGREGPEGVVTTEEVNESVIEKEENLVGDMGAPVGADERGEASRTPQHT